MPHRARTAAAESGGMATDADPSTASTFSTTVSTTVPSAGTIVVGVDGSPGAAHAARWAAGLAGVEHRPLTLLNAEQPLSYDHLGMGGFAGVDWPSVREDARAAQQALVARAREELAAARPDVDVRAVAATGDPRAVLADASSGARLVVVGTRGLGRLGRLLLGSVSTAAVRHAAGPVAVVPASAPADGVTAGGPGVLHAVVDVEHDAGPLLEEAMRLGAETGRPLVVHPAHWHDVRDPVDDDLRRLLGETVAGWQEKYPDVEIRLDAQHGKRALYAYEHGRPPYPFLGTVPSDLVVVGRPAHRLSFVGPAFPGVHEAVDCPVVVVPLGG